LQTLNTILAQVFRQSGSLVSISFARLYRGLNVPMLKKKLHEEANAGKHFD